ncbi:endonuclease/exonuclease/phosphatase family protein [Loktanella sp. TSTF-M6]|uniref:Endonuclease/exonuclease/phosphatase family protein n=1 Tax=Loktanella gaetbuli TaxID=2881335 RepID=A0ABS8BY97_9RHOB|nr:endonuclease/exonuclease/phosphatase family protein [Loktanella gaetbuli]MCB5200710.1 endonuclease/exonuclease/phosphatase family protein [Loktanella gaetbuli]
MTDRRHPMTCVTWNLHRTVGRDGRADADRIVSVMAADIAAHQPQILALQEADSDDIPPQALLDLDAVSRATGLRSQHANPNMRCGGTAHGCRGNILLLDPEMIPTSQFVLRLPGRYHRAAVVTEVLYRGAVMRIIACHLALLQVLRLAQMRAIARALVPRSVMPTILLGDLNEWRPWGGLALHPWATSLPLTGPRVRTFPVQAPVLALDRVLTCPALRVDHAAALDSPGIRAASDHRPLLARITRLAA